MAFHASLLPLALCVLHLRSFVAAAKRKLAAVAAREDGCSDDDIADASLIEESIAAPSGEAITIRYKGVDPALALGSKEWKKAKRLADNRASAAKSRALQKLAHDATERQVADLLAANDELRRENAALKAAAAAGAQSGSSCSEPAVNGDAGNGEAPSKRSRMSSSRRRALSPHSSSSTASDGSASGVDSTSSSHSDSYSSSSSQSISSSLSMQECAAPAVVVPSTTAGLAGCRSSVGPKAAGRSVSAAACVVIPDLDATAAAAASAPASTAWGEPSFESTSVASNSSSPLQLVLPQHRLRGYSMEDDDYSGVGGRANLSSCAQSANALLASQQHKQQQIRVAAVTAALPSRTQRDACHHRPIALSTAASPSKNHTQQRRKGSSSGGGNALLIADLEAFLDAGDAGGVSSHAELEAFLETGGRDDDWSSGGESATAEGGEDSSYSSSSSSSGGVGMSPSLFSHSCLEALSDGHAAASASDTRAAAGPSLSCDSSPLSSSSLEGSYSVRSSPLLPSSSASPASSLLSSAMALLPTSSFPSPWSAGAPAARANPMALLALHSDSDADESDATSGSTMMMLQHESSSQVEVAHENSSAAAAINASTAGSSSVRRPAHALHHAHAPFLRGPVSTAAALLGMAFCVALFSVVSPPPPSIPSVPHVFGEDEGPGAPAAAGDSAGLGSNFNLERGAGLGRPSSFNARGSFGDTEGPSFVLHGGAVSDRPLVAFDDAAEDDIDDDERDEEAVDMEEEGALADAADLKLKLEEAITPSSTAAAVAAAASPSNPDARSGIPHRGGSVGGELRAPASSSVGQRKLLWQRQAGQHARLPRGEQAQQQQQPPVVLSVGAAAQRRVALLREWQSDLAVAMHEGDDALASLPRTVDADVDIDMDEETPSPSSSSTYATAGAAPVSSLSTVSSPHTSFFRVLQSALTSGLSGAATVLGNTWNSSTGGNSNRSTASSRCALPSSPLSSFPSVVVAATAAESSPLCSSMREGGFFPSFASLPSTPSSFTSLPGPSFASHEEGGASPFALLRDETEGGSEAMQADANGLPSPPYLPLPARAEAVAPPSPAPASSSLFFRSVPPSPTALFAVPTNFNLEELSPSPLPSPSSFNLDRAFPNASASYTTLPAQQQHPIMQHHLPAQQQETSVAATAAAAAANEVPIAWPTPPPLKSLPPQQQPHLFLRGSSSSSSSRGGGGGAAVGPPQCFPNYTLSSSSSSSSFPEVGISASELFVQQQQQPQYLAKALPTPHQQQHGAAAQLQKHSAGLTTTAAASSAVAAAAAALGEDAAAAAAAAVAHRRTSEAAAHVRHRRSLAARHSALLYTSSTSRSTASTSSARLVDAARSEPLLARSILRLLSLSSDAAGGGSGSSSSSSSDATGVGTNVEVHAPSTHVEVDEQLSQDLLRVLSSLGSNASSFFGALVNAFWSPAAAAGSSSATVVQGVGVVVASAVAVGAAAARPRGAGVAVGAAK